MYNKMFKDAKRDDTHTYMYASEPFITYVY